MKERKIRIIPNYVGTGANWNWIPKPSDEPDAFHSFYKTVNVCDIIDADKTSIRESVDQEAIDRIARKIRWIREYWTEMVYNVEIDDVGIWQRSFIPKIYIVAAPGRSGKYWIIDGVHRFKAAIAAGLNELPVEEALNVSVETLDDLHFLQARNYDVIYVRRTAETMKRQVETTLKRRPHWTDVQICNYCQVWEEFVAQVRRDMEQAGQIEPNPNALDGQPVKQMNLI